MTVMVAVITCGIVSYLFLNCIESIRDKANAKHILVEDTDIQPTHAQNSKATLADLDQSENNVLMPGSAKANNDSNRHFNTK